MEEYPVQSRKLGPQLGRGTSVPASRDHVGLLLFLFIVVIVVVALWLRVLIAIFLCPAAPWWRRDMSKPWSLRCRGHTQG